MDFSVYSADKINFYYRNWEQIARWYKNCQQGVFRPKDLPAPVTVNLDAAHACQMSCIGCKVANILRTNDYDKQIMDRDYLLELPQAWQDWGVEAVCIAGAGESTLNKSFGDFLSKCKEINFPSALICNGLIFLPEMAHLDWIGMSVDAAYSHTWAKVHGMKKPELFNTVLDNLKKLTDLGVHTTYKFLIRPDNVNEIFDAAVNAQKIGCKYFQVRPMANAWFADPNKPVFTEEEVIIGMDQLNEAKKYCTTTEINGTFTKFGEHWRVEHPFDMCWSIYMYAIFLANRRVLMCADLYGCDSVEVGPFDHPQDFIENFWGSKEHFEMQSKIDVTKCSRCNYKLFNQLMEKGVLQDGMFRKFL